MKKLYLLLCLVLMVNCSVVAEEQWKFPCVNVNEGCPSDFKELIAKLNKRNVNTPLTVHLAGKSIETTDVAWHRIENLPYTLTFRGDSLYGTRLILKDATKLVVKDSKKPFIIENLSIESSHRLAGLLVKNQDLHIKNVRFKNPDGQCVLIADDDNSDTHVLTISNSYFQSCQQALNVNQIANINLNNTVFDSNQCTR